MTNFTINNEDLAVFAEDLLRHSRTGLLSITITRLDASEDFSVSIVTNSSSEDFVKIMVQRHFNKLTFI